MFSKDKTIENLEHYNNDSRHSIDSMFYDQTDGKYFNNLPKALSIPSNENDNFFKVDLKRENRLDLIANLFYNNSRLWWVIADVNGLDDPFDAPLNSTLTIPSISSIFGVGGVLE